jgi:hypothetical protein
MLNGNGALDTSTHRLVALIIPATAEPKTEELRKPVEPSHRPGEKADPELERD